jgi:hypothetical protein
MFCYYADFQIAPNALAISLDDEDQDMRDVEDYIQKAREAADREDFSAADDFLKRAAKYGMAKEELKVAVFSNNDNLLSVNSLFGSECIRGSYSFTYAADAGMACDKRVGYLGTFYLDGKYKYYNIFLSGDTISVNGY